MADELIVLEASRERDPDGALMRAALGAHLELERLHVDTFEALERSYAYLVGSGLSTGSVTPPGSAAGPADSASPRPPGRDCS